MEDLGDRLSALVVVAAWRASTVLVQRSRCVATAAPRPSGDLALDKAEGDAASRTTHLNDGRHDACARRSPEGAKRKMRDGTPTAADIVDAGEVQGLGARSSTAPPSGAAEAPRPGTGGCGDRSCREPRAQDVLGIYLGDVWCLMPAMNDVAAATPAETWAIDDARELYMIDRWGGGHFDVERGRAAHRRPAQENAEKKIAVHEVVALPPPSTACARRSSSASRTCSTTGSAGPSTRLSLRRHRREQVPRHLPRRLASDQGQPDARGRRGDPPRPVALYISESRTEPIPRCSPG